MRNQYPLEHKKIAATLLNISPRTPDDLAYTPEFEHLYETFRAQADESIDRHYLHLLFLYVRKTKFAA